MTDHAGVPFASTHPAELRAAIVRAILERDMPATRARELAAAGNLEPGLAAATVPIGTVRDWARDERRRRGASAAAAQGPAAMLQGYAGRLAQLLERETARLERQRRGPLDTRRVADLARAGRELAALSRAIGAEPGAGAAAAPDAPASSPGDAPAGGFLAELAARGPDTSGAA
jgi:hypothetical protein